MDLHDAKREKEGAESEQQLAESHRQQVTVRVGRRRIECGRGGGRGGLGERWLVEWRDLRG